MARPLYRCRFAMRTARRSRLGKLSWTIGSPASLFGGLCWAGRSQRRVTYYNQDIDDVEAFCDDIGCDDTCASDEYQSDNSATGDRDD
jgi:hypothetical protein